MNVLAALNSWPVSRAAAAVLSPAGVLATHGRLDEPFHLASVTKPLVALGIAVAVEEGALHWDDPVPAPLAAILPGATLEQLLAHASGLAPERPIRAAVPGTRRIYSNAGFDVIGQLAEAATGISFSDYLAEAVFTPLGMQNASLQGSPARDGRAGVNDLVALLARFLDPAGFLDASTLATMTTVHFPGLRGVLPGFGQQADNAWGLGVEIRATKSPHWTSTRNSPATFGHFGQSGTMFWVDPEAQLALVALADRDFDEWATRAWPALSDAVLDTFG